MTAPAITPSAPVAPIVPVLPVAPALPRTQHEALETIVSETLRQSPATQAPAALTAPIAEVPVDDRLRDPVTGRFLPADATATEALPVEGVEGALPEVEAPALELPEGFVAPPALDEERARGFHVYQGDDEVIPPDLTWKITANGKERTLPTDKLVSYAQMGVYNHEREQHAQHVEQQNVEIARRLHQTEQNFMAVQRDVARLFTDPHYLAAQLAEFEANNTPEARARSEQQRLDQERQAFAHQQAAGHAQQFLDGQIAPALEQIATALPTVSREELAARLFLAAEPYRMNGILHPNGFDAVRQFVTNDLVPWAKQLHEQRSTEREAPKQQATKDVQAAQARAQQARRAVTQAIKPRGRAMPDSQAPKPVRTMKDADDAVISRTLTAMR